MPTERGGSEDDRRSPKGNSGLDDYFRVMEKRGWSRGNAEFYMSYLFKGVDLRGKTMLDVGAGDGRFSLYAASAGAAHVVSLEPEASGSSHAIELFRELDALLPANAELVRQSIQDFPLHSRAFDILFLHASVNHLDEEACMRLHVDDPTARAVYTQLFAKLAGVARRGAVIIVVDAARGNLFGDLGLKNPFAPNIEWDKHQAPELWAGLLGEVGFTQPKIRWNSFNTLRRPGRLVAGNRAASYCLDSMFCLTMEMSERDIGARPPFVRRV